MLWTGPLLGAGEEGWPWPPSLMEGEARASNASEHGREAWAWPLLGSVTSRGLSAFLSGRRGVGLPPPRGREIRRVPAPVLARETRRGMPPPERRHRLNYILTWEKRRRLGPPGAKNEAWAWSRPGEGRERGLVLFLLQNKGSYELERLLEKIRWRSLCPLFQRSGFDFFIELEQQTRRGHDHLLDQETTHGLGPILEHEMRRGLAPSLRETRLPLAPLKELEVRRGRGPFWS